MFIRFIGEVLEKQKITNHIETKYKSHENYIN